VIIFKTYFENNQNILTSSSSMGFLPIKLMIIIISSFSIFSFIYFSTFVSTVSNINFIMIVFTC
jgi:hypothetical protein